MNPPGHLPHLWISTRLRAMNTKTPEPLIRTEKLRIERSGRTVLRDCTFSLFPEERIALTGPNGSGKTTFLLSLLGIITPFEGTIELFGKNRKHESDFRDVRGPIGLLFQESDDQLFCPTVIEDVMFGPMNLGKSQTEARDIAMHVLCELGLEGFESRIPYRLSGGEKRLVALATVLSMQPKVLLLDEATSGLDDDSAQRILSVLETLPQAMVIVSHDASVLDRLATRSVRMAGGVIAPVDD